MSGRSNRLPGRVSYLGVPAEENSPSVPEMLLAPLREMIDALRSAGATPRFHGGIGMVQLHLDRLTRIHVWHPKMPVTRPDSAIHNHRFSFRSTVLRGELLHRIVAPITGSDYELWEAFTEDSREPELVGKCSLDTVEEVELTPGEGYSFEAGRFHCSEARGIVVTRMTKTWESNGKVFVVAKPGVDMKHAFKGSPQRIDEMWDLIFDAIS